MAAVLQHQVESRVNDLYMKLQRHAQIIMRLSVEVDKLHQENDELKNALQHNIRAVRHLETETANVGKDIRTTEMSQQYQEFEEEEHEES